ncbi:bifunctional proline dehydrogenase/L-glutamate gamma-semialdehyde dehydrogenase [Aeromicrobium piscarium]|uniref:L-glutamate gamma-semialdehyde dehydrogenase n=1 Tax=Aeromicrobium piscarium TaxID=2590901 RepID=A0A554RX06_9ACTN|nr:bifunctional proline dehydrogenase/L-glutamate gamma-semialdehyde dehydrogenase [Aeromicrobium piscarium]TSD58638.1 aldehyde dehydrogenase family protein [Aeromicrobium piscarium]
MTAPLPLPDSLADDAVALVRAWLQAAEKEPVDRSAAQLAGLLKDPKGLDFTVGFIDGVIRPEDERIAAQKFAELARDVPGFLQWYLKVAVKVGAVAGRVAPRLVIPIVRRVLRQMVGHLVIDARDEQLGQAIAKIRKPGTRLNMNLLGEAVLGEEEAAKRLEGTHTLLAREDVDYVSIKVSSTVAPHNRWAFDDAADHIVESLVPLYERAAAAPTPKFINLDMEEYHDLDLTIEVFTRILDMPQFEKLQGGIVLQAYLPDALGAMQRVQDWAAKRVARGGASVKVRVVKGANLPMEQVEASLHGWPLATWSSKAESDASYKSVIDYALNPDHIANVRVGVAGHNLFDLAWTWLLAGERGVRSGVDFEMLLGMAPGQAAAVRRDVGELLLYTPVVHPREFDVAIAYLIRRLEEGASSENFMSAVFELSANEDLFRREEQRFRTSLGMMFTEAPLPNRAQDRRADPEPFPAEFANTPDTDPSLPANLEWARGIFDRIDDSVLGEDVVAEHTIAHPRDLDDQITGAVDASASWGALSGAERADILVRAAHSLEKNRAGLLEVMASECGKTLDQSDPEVSEAIDFALHYAELARQLDEVDGAEFHPVGLTLVVPPWNFPVAIPAGSTLAALAAGSSVIIKPAPQARRCGAIMVQALWEAGVPRDVLRLVNVGEDQLGRQLISDPRVDRLILTGAFETAELFRSFRPDLPLFGETSGKNSIIVAESADLDLAVKDVVYSAFGHAGQKCSAASLVILVGSVAKSPRFRRQLLDAVRSLKVAWPSDPTAQMGPVVEPAEGKLLRGLTKLGSTETWLVRPQQLDETGRLWSPGVRDGVAPGSEYHLTEYFGPILGIMTADTLEEAIELQNRVEYGLTAGLHSLDADDIELWLREVQAGNVYVNRGITGAIVRRQPFGGWKKSAVGPGAKAGGPNYLVALGDWTSSEATAQDSPADDVVRFVQEAAKVTGLDDAARERLTRATHSDAAMLRTEFGIRKDVSGLTAERNVFRYLPCPAVIRFATGGDVADLVRVAAAAISVDAPVTVSLPDRRYAALFEGTGLDVEVLADEAWLRALASGPAQRVRLVGGSAASVYPVIGGRPDVAVYDHEVTEAGRIELLPFLHEQAISITAHRFGTPNHLTDAII